MDAQRLKNEIKARMEAAGLGQKALALAAGLNETAVRDILKGKSDDPRYGTLLALAKVLKCSVLDLTGDPAPAASSPANDADTAPAGGNDVVYPTGRPAPDRARIGSRIEHWMKKKKITPTDLTRRAKLSPKRLKALIKGEPERRGELEAIAEVLDVPVGHLLDFTAKDEQEAMFLHRFRRAADKDRFNRVLDAIDPEE